LRPEGTPEYGTVETNIYRCEAMKRTISVKRHDFNENDLKNLLKQAGLNSPALLGGLKIFCIKKGELI